MTMATFFHHHRIFGALAVAAALACISVPGFVFAQTSGATALTITPPFFELNLNPGDTWSSSIRVVNTNGGDLPVKATVMGFTASDDEGHGTFVDPATLAGDPDALTNWIVVSDPSVVVPRGGSADVPFTIVVPHDASPGGHYAAILIGTASPAAADAGSYVGVSSYISALIFVRVSGDVKEEGSVQEFSTDKSLYQDSNVNFTIRFANTGDVHLRPAGDVTIYNAFGKVRGKVDVNQAGDLGYVLPSSTRLFNVSWSGGSSLLDIGPYTAVVTLAYGDNGEKSTSATATFWILPIANIVEVLLGVLLVGGLFVFAMKRFMKGMLAREMRRYGVVPLPSLSKVPEVYHQDHDGGHRADSSTSRTVDLRRHHDEE